MKSLLTLNDLCERFHLSKASIYRLISEENFPAPLKLGRCSRWPEGDVVAWLEQRSRQAPSEWSNSELRAKARRRARVGSVAS